MYVFKYSSNYCAIKLTRSIKKLKYCIQNKVSRYAYGTALQHEAEMFTQGAKPSDFYSAASSETDEN